MNLNPLIEFIKKTPAVTFVNGELVGDMWYVKFGIDISSKYAWNVVQEFGFVLNYLSTAERLPTVFMPVSPPP